MSSDTQRKHSIFGDYILVDKKHSSVNVSDTVPAEVEDYNALWSRYTQEVAGGWGIGSIPTEKGFEKWLQQQ